MNTLGRVLVFGFVLLSVGCTKGTPDFATLDENSVPQPTFGGGATLTNITVTSPAAAIPVTGDCNSRISALVAVTVGGNTAMSLASMVSGGVQVDCTSTGHFSFTLTNIAALGFVLVDEQSYDIQLRGVTAGGISRPSTIHLKYSPYRPERVMITSGSTDSAVTGNPRLATSASFKAVVRLGHFSNATLTNVNEPLIKSSTNFKYKGGVAGAVDY